MSTRVAAYRFTGPDALLSARVPLLSASVAQDALAGDVTALRALMCDDLFLRALYLSAPDLHSKLLDELHSDELTDDTAGRVLRHIARMSVRTAPFGLSAAVGLVSQDEETTLSLSREIRSRTRVDMGWLTKFVEQMEDDRTVLTRLRLFDAGIGLIRRDRIYFEAGMARSIRRIEAVDLILDMCSNGATIHELAAALTAKLGVPCETAERFVMTVWKTGLLVSELRPPLYTSAFAYVRETALRLGSHLTSELDNIATSIDRLDRDASSDEYVDIGRQMRSAAQYENGHMHVDSFRTLSGELGANVMSDVSTLAHTMLSLGRVFSLSRYRQRFIERYEGKSRLVPLLELCDRDFGIGQPDGIDTEHVHDIAAAERLLMECTARAIRDRSEEYRLSDNEYAALTANAPPDEFMPPSFEIAFQIAARSNEAIRAGDYAVVPSSFDVSYGAGLSLSRFAEELGAGTQAKLSCLRFEEQVELPTELFYVPDHPQAANVALRNSSASHQIQVGYYDVKTASRIRLRDVWIGIDGEKFYAYAPKIDARLGIYEAHLLSKQDSHGALRLLRLLALQGRILPERPDLFSTMLPFTPRISYNRVVIALARWSVEARALQSVESARVKLGRMEGEWGLPHYVRIRWKNRDVVVDLRSDHGISTVVEAARASADDRIALAEFYPGIDDTWLCDGTARYFAEFVASGIITRPLAKVSRVSPEPVSRCDRSRDPASEWLYLKLYCGFGLHDHVLLKLIQPHLKLFREGLPEMQWSFLRYADPAPHLRLRLHLPLNTVAEARAEWSSLCSMWREDGAIERFAIDTYEREIERYGGAKAMTHFEDIFRASSDLALTVLDLGAKTDERVVETLRTVDRLLTALFSDAELDVWVDQTRRKSRLITKQWQLVRTLVETIGRRQSSHDDGLSRLVERLRTERAGKLQHSYESIVRDVIHLHFNRCGVANGAEEDLLDILARSHYGVRSKRHLSSTS